MVFNSDVMLLSSMVANDIPIVCMLRKQFQKFYYIAADSLEGLSMLS